MKLSSGYTTTSLFLSLTVSEYVSTIVRALMWQYKWLYSPTEWLKSVRVLMWNVECERVRDYLRVFAKEYTSGVLQ